MAEEETSFGGPAKKQNKKTQAAAVKEAAEKKRPAKVPTKNPEAEEKKAKPQASIKDIVVVADENVVPVDESRKPASFVFIGHVDAGKSTICGNLIY